MIPHAAVIASSWEGRDVFCVFEGWVHEELVVPNISADRLFKVLKGDATDMCGDT